MMFCIGVLLITFQMIVFGIDGQRDTTKVQNYLTRYGYVSKYTASKEDVEYGLKQFQQFAGLPQTGRVDAATMRQMETPRCGLKDPVKRLNITTRRKRFNHQGTRWRKNILTWKYDKQTRDLDPGTVRRVLIAAMKVWSDKTNIEFRESTADEVDIFISFVEDIHGDPFSFDGQGGTLAHAYYPLTNTGLAGDVHFDDAERYTVGVNDPYGTDLMWVATHELGHSLGLDHTPVQGAIMYPYYIGYKENVKLDYDDIVGIQTLYGGPRPKPKPTTTTTTTTKKPVLPKSPCPSSTVTAVWFLKFFKLFVFITSDQQLYFVRTNGQLRAGPLPVTTYFPKYRVSNGVDAVFTHDMMFDDLLEYTIVFSGNSYSLYQKFHYVDGPHSIHTGAGPLKLRLPYSVKKIEAALTWHRDGKVYLFSGSQYWSYDIITKRLDAGYPRMVDSYWRGIGKKIDAAIRLDMERTTFFFSGYQVYRTNDMAQVQRGYPKAIGEDLWRCNNK